MAVHWNTVGPVPRPLIETVEPLGALVEKLAKVALECLELAPRDTTLQLYIAKPRRQMSMLETPPWRADVEVCHHGVTAAFQVGEEHVNLVELRYEAGRL